MKLSKLSIIIFSSSFLVACGGGGDAATGVAVGNGPVAAPVALNSSNKTIAAQETVSTALLPLDLAETLTGSQLTDESAIFKFAYAQQKKISTYALNASRNKTLVGSVETETLNCSRGGTLTVSASIARPDGEPTAGDSFTITANNCVESDGTITGILRLSINTLSGIFYSDNYSGSVTFTFDSLSVSDSQFSARVNGLLTLATTATGINRFTDSYSTPSLAVTASYAGETRSRTLSGFSAIQTRTPVGSSFSTNYDIRGTVTSSALESKSVSFATTTLLVESASDFYPSSGVVTISGAANSKIKLNALPASLVLQELDANGDGIFESSSTISWSSLL